MNSDLLQAGELALTANLALFLAQRQLRLDELAHDFGEATSLGVGQVGECAVLFRFK